MKVQQYLPVFLAATTSFTSIWTMTSPMTSYASTTNLDYRKRVVGIAGIMQNTSTEMQAPVTRGAFAYYLANASVYKDYLTKTNKVAVYADVPQSHEYSAAIRLTAQNDWMRAYLGGLFKPDQPVTMKEAVRGIMALLGYADSDFVGDINGSRMAKFHELKLNDNLNLEAEEILTKNDCVNLFYNLLKTAKKDGKIYATVLGCSVNADGEINPMGLADTNLSGPKFIQKGRALGDAIPFNVQEASFYLDGDPKNYESMKNLIKTNSLVVYYNQQARTVWAYQVMDDPDEDIQNGRLAIHGTVDHIYYSSAEVMTPSYITLEGTGDTQYKTSSSEMQFAFSIYGSVRVGDRVTLILEKTNNNSGNAVYTVVDYLLD